MKKFLISTAILAITSTSALAGGWSIGGNGGNGGNGGTGLSSFIMAPITSTNTVNQSALAMPLSTTSTTVNGGAGGTTSYVTSTVNQTANAMNVFSSSIASTVHY